MAKLIVTLSPELEQRLRNHIRKRGDLSKHVSEALEQYLDNVEEDRIPKIVDEEPHLVPFTRSRYFRRLIKAELSVSDNQSATLRMHLDSARLDYLLAKASAEREKTQEEDSWITEHGKTIQQLWFVPTEELAKRDVYIDIARVIREEINPWAERELEKHSVVERAIRMEFDPESTFRLCPSCKEFNDEDICWSCKRELPEFSQVEDEAV